MDARDIRFLKAISARTAAPNPALRKPGMPGSLTMETIAWDTGVLAYGLDTPTDVDAAWAARKRLFRVGRIFRIAR